MKILIFANDFVLISGGDKIFVEYGKRWKEFGAETVYITNEKGKKFCLENSLLNTDIVVWPTSSSDKFGVFFSSFYKSIYSFFRAWFINVRDVNIVFSASFIWPDLLPGLVVKWRKPSVKFVVASYIFITPPWSSFNPGNWLNGSILYFVQLISLFLMKKYADGVFTASPVDIPKLIRVTGNNPKVIALRGGTDVNFFAKIPEQKFRYHCIYLGRFHPQKNLEEMLRIWSKVKLEVSDFKVALVGSGDIESKLRTKAKELGLAQNIYFLGILDGEEKALILKSSRLFTSASRFDSGNLALDEALACGVPGITYDLPHLDYPQGVIKIPVGNQEEFAATIIDLLNNEEKRIALGKKGFEFAKTIDWNHKALEAFRFIQKL